MLFKNKIKKDLLVSHEDKYPVSFDLSINTSQPSEKKYDVYEAKQTTLILLIMSLYGVDKFSGQLIFPSPPFPVVKWISFFEQWK